MITSSLLPLLVAGALPADSSSFARPIHPVEPLAAEAELGWSGSVTLGATLSTGNTENRSASASADSLWRGEENRLTLGALWNYQSNNTDGVTQRKLYGSGQFDHFYNEKTYSYANASGDHDFNSTLDLRWTGGLGLGHQFRDDDQWSVSGEVGLSYIDEDFGETLGVKSADTDYLAARLAYNTAYLAGENWEFAHSGELFPGIDGKNENDNTNFYSRLDTRLKTNLTETMFAQIQWIWEHNNSPADGKGRDDSLFALTVGWSF